MLIGYARVSTEDQSLTLQIDVTRTSLKYKINSVAQEIARLSLRSLQW